MTAQISDTVTHAGEQWQLAAIDGEGLFKPAMHGLTPRPASSACWRGFVCRYELRDEHLVLEDLDIALQHSPPAVLGREPQEPKSGFTGAYRSMGAPVRFTGGLLVVRNFVRELYVHMGFHPAWKYPDVLEVELDQGRIVRITDCSASMAAIRERLAGRDAPDAVSSREEIATWIARAFSRKYR